MINWRDYGPIDQTTFLNELRAVSSPLLSEWDQMLDVAGDHSAVVAGILAEESRYGTSYRLNHPENRNPANLRPRGGSGYLKFATYTACIFELVSRITDPSYAYRDTVSLLDLVSVYAPKSDSNDPEQYTRDILTRFARWGITPKEQSVSISFGHVKHPAFWDRLIPNNENGAWDDLGQRKPVGVCQHSMVGTLSGTDQWFRRGAASNGLTDYGIGGSPDGANDGVIYRWNNPLGRKSGWANGGSDGLEGDGPLFVRTLGVNAINRDLVSIERSDGGDITTPMSAKQFESICALSAHWFDFAQVPYDQFPLNPKFGIVTHFLHKEFATKDCPHPPVYNRIDEIQNRIRAILKAGQLQVVEEPTVPPVIPPTPNHEKWPYKVEDLKARFGAVPIIQTDGSVKHQRFSEKGAISNAWANRAKRDGIKKVADIPPPLQGFEAIDSDGLKQTIITFDGRGKGVWVLFRPAREVSWRWLT